MSKIGQDPPGHKSPLEECADMMWITSLLTDSLFDRKGNEVIRAGLIKLSLLDAKELQGKGLIWCRPLDELIAQARRSYMEIPKEDAMTPRHIDA